MKHKKGAAIAMTLLMVLVSSTMIVKAAEEPPVPIPFTPVDSAPGYAVYFADNMAFTPQWRIGNLVRIEMMVLKVSAGVVDNNLTTPIVVNARMDNPTVVYDQADLIADPSLILSTWMVSVPVISVTMTVGDRTETFTADFTDADDEVLGREINKAGHLIYGMLWDTTGWDAGIPKISVNVPNYPISWAARSYVAAEEDDATAFELLPLGDPMIPVSGTGGMDAGDAYIYLGKLITKGGGGGKGNR